MLRRRHRVAPCGVLGHIVEGIDQATAKKINKDIKDQKLKVKVTIEADKLRVSSASKDALQTVIQFPARPGLRPAAAVHQLPLISIERTALQHGYTVGLRALHHPRVR